MRKNEGKRKGSVVFRGVARDGKRRTGAIVRGKKKW